MSGEKRQRPIFHENSGSPEKGLKESKMLLNDKASCLLTFGENRISLKNLVPDI